METVVSDYFDASYEIYEGGVLDVKGEWTWGSRSSAHGLGREQPPHSSDHRSFLNQVNTAYWLRSNLATTRIERVLSKVTSIEVFGISRCKNLFLR